jgi:hypothetical protein
MRWYQKLLVCAGLTGLTSSLIAHWLIRTEEQHTYKFTKARLNGKLVDASKPDYDKDFWKSEIEYTVRAWRDAQARVKEARPGKMLDLNREEDYEEVMEVYEKRKAELWRTEGN